MRWESKPTSMVHLATSGRARRISDSRTQVAGDERRQRRQGRCTGGCADKSARCLGQNSETELLHKKPQDLIVVRPGITNGGDKIPTDIHISAVTQKPQKC